VQTKLLRFEDKEKRIIENYMAVSLQIRGRLLIKAGWVIRHCIPVSRRYIHSSVYEKNEDEGARLTRVPEDVIQAKSEKWWLPHPKTGVFGPAEVQGWAGGDRHHSREKSDESVLEQQAWFRPLEDVQKQPSN
jgi:hypothetical protein